MSAFSSAYRKAYVCGHVFENTRPILLVAHEDEDWMFLCGRDDHDPDTYKVVGVGHLISRDTSLQECADLEDGFEAERPAVGRQWIRTAIDANAC